MVADVRRAYFCARARRPIYVEIPAEVWEYGDDMRCAELVQSMYGTRDAARNWSEELRSTMIGMRADPGLATPCTFHLRRDGYDARIVIHGDDIVVAGLRHELDLVQKSLEERFSMKVTRVGLDDDLEWSVKVLNRVLSADPDGFTLEADPRHQRMLIQEMGVETGRGPLLP